MTTDNQQHRAILQSIAHRVMLEHGLLPDFSPDALAELDRLPGPARAGNGADGGSPVIRDLTGRLWASIDNEDSLDLDQLTVAEALPGDKTRILVAVADVDALVKDGSAIDDHARHNTTSVYTPAQIFPMLPDKLSTDLTSLKQGEERLVIVVDMVIDGEGAVLDSEIYRALVLNRAKLAYNSVAAWLEGEGPTPQAIAAVDGLDANLRLQDRVAQCLHQQRHVQGALSLETIESRPVFDGDEICSLEKEERNRARALIEDFMIAANGATARYLAAQKFPSIRRVVRSPRRWDRIVELAEQHGYKLPGDPDARALDEFLLQQKEADPLRFPDLSLAVIKLLGAGEYVADMPGDAALGHFGLAVKDYAHSTAPNRRYPDLTTQRLVKAAIAGQPVPYSYADLDALARHFTEEEDAAHKVERQVDKSAAALFLQARIGERFDALVTGAAEKGTWARLLNMPVEGRVVQGYAGLDVGDRIHVQLVGVDVDRGYIDFRKVGSDR